ncbi:MAG: N-acetylmuramoyl-L-alanine amidase family protein [Lachnospiraceae bacterium]|nr:N-acetylmuramoyl-L-alanine amidase family protein [Lachnospiraceae bacterium]
MREIGNGIRLAIKRAVLTGIVALGVMGSTVTSQAASQGWREDSTGWWYQFADGSYARQVWLNENDIWYAFDEEGYMITGWCKLDGIWYYFRPDGVMHTGWLKDGNTWYMFNTSGAMHTGWYEDTNGKWYYLREDGAMAESTWIGSDYVDSTGAWVEGMAPQEDVESKIKAAIARLETKYPEGAYWNHMGMEGDADYSSTVTAIPCNHAEYNLAYCNSYILGNVRGYQCDGFARKLSDEIFGRTAMLSEYEYSFDKVKTGDYLRYSNSKDSYVSNGHSVLVIDKTADKLIVTEANYGGSCMIHWRGELTRAYLDSMYAECFTRY